MESIYTETEEGSGSSSIDQIPRRREIGWSERQSVSNLRLLHRSKESLDNFFQGLTSPLENERADFEGSRFGFLKVRAIRGIGHDRTEIELELAPDADRNPIDLELLGLRDIQIVTRESGSGERSIWLTGSGYFSGSVGDTVRLLPMGEISRKPGEKVYWRKTYLVDVFIRDTNRQTGLELPKVEKTQQYIVDLVSRSASDQYHRGDPGDSQRAKSAALYEATELALKTDGSRREVVLGQCSLLLREPVTGVANYQRERIRVRAR
jgi:hypothetical protein